MDYGKSILKRFGSIANIDLSNYVQKVTGKSLIADSEITRLANVTGGTLTPEQLAAIAAQVPAPAASAITQDTTHRFHTDSQKNTWDAKINDNDSRLIDARVPTPHSHEANDISGTAVLTNDNRLTNSRTPTTHSHSASDVTGTAVLTNDVRLTNARPASDVSTWAKQAIKPSYNASEVGAEDANGNIQGHISSDHAVSNAQKNSDITKGEIEYKLTGELTTHTHAAASPTWRNGIATKNITDVSSVQNIPHGLGRVPKHVRIDGAVIISAAITQTCIGCYDGTNNSGLSVAIGEGTSTAATDAVYTSTSIALGFSPLVATNVFTGANRQTGVISVDATNIIITWTKTGTITGTVSLIWQCT